MTRKEAIEVLKKNKPTSDPRRCGIELCEAVDMAIEALQKSEIVHCNKCKLRKTEECAMYYKCDCGEQHTWENDNDYCSWGIKAGEQE